MSSHLSEAMLLGYLWRTSTPAELIATDDHLTVCSDCRERLLTFARERTGLSEQANPRTRLASNFQLPDGRLPEMVHTNPEKLPDFESTNLGTDTEVPLGESEPDLSLDFQGVIRTYGDSNTSADSIFSELTPTTDSDHLSYEILEASVDGSATVEQRNRILSHILKCPSCTQELQDLRAFAPDSTESFVPQPAMPMRKSQWWKTFTSWFTFRRAALVGVLASVVIFATMLGTFTLTTQDTMRDAAKAANPTEKAQHPLITSSSSSDIHVLLAEAIENERLDTPKILNDLAVTQYSLRRGSGSSESFPLLTPVGTLILSPTPTFRWIPQAGVDGYTVRVYDSKFEPVEWSPIVTAPEWKSKVALHPGMTYLWDVQFIKNGEAVMDRMTEVPQARFRVLESSQQKQIKAFKSAHPEAHFELGVLLAHSGVLDDAIVEFQAVPDSDQGQKLTASLSSLDKHYLLAHKFVNDLHLLRARAH